MLITFTCLIEITMNMIHCYTGEICLLSRDFLFTKYSRLPLLRYPWDIEKYLYSRVLDSSYYDIHGT